jgi:hypothetical protein
MKLIHEGGYSRDERESFKEIIFSNTVQSMRVILEAWSPSSFLLMINAPNTTSRQFSCNLPRSRETASRPKLAQPSRLCGKTLVSRNALDARENIN